MHDNVSATIVALNVVMSVSSSIGRNVSQLVTMLFISCCTGRIAVVSGRIVN